MTRIYEQLNTKTLGDVEAIDIQALQDKVHIQEINKQELETYNLINQATFRDGNVMPNSGGVESYLQSDGNVGVNIKPPSGQVWKIMGISLKNSATPTGTNYYNTFLSTPATTAANDTPSQANGDVSYSSIASASTASEGLLSCSRRSARCRPPMRLAWWA